MLPYIHIDSLQSHNTSRVKGERKFLRFSKLVK